MRATKTTKGTDTTLTAINSSTINTSTQTPIEIALQIDENGMTTASKLYSFFGIEPKSIFKMV